MGSSPLARGLLPSNRGPAAHRGIIPARAGFTGCEGLRRRPGGDHPRSRGVYTAAEGVEDDEPGSSPLARGLPRIQPHFSPPHRIIPARAGFTIKRCMPCDTVTDHPRSRGVYRGTPGRRGERCGSSPLARGLRREHLQPRLAAGIIPARAGFTSTSSASTSGMRDHPRSRGVYSSTSRPASPPLGSSPLARGLRRGTCGRRILRRIIPARAGFTWSVSRPPRRPGDHPRSRGVYRTGCSGRSWRSGSSPLARGLRLEGRAATRIGGIIPARAGFTSSMNFGISIMSDHPRSRGVY